MSHDAEATVASHGHQYTHPFTHSAFEKPTPMPLQVPLQDHRADTLAARLRALMSTISSKSLQSTPPPPPKPPSSLDPDFETPHVGQDKSSIADYSSTVNANASLFSSQSCNLLSISRASTCFKPLLLEDGQPNALRESARGDTSTPESQNDHPVRSFRHNSAGSRLLKGFKEVIITPRMVDAYGRETKSERDEPHIKRKDVNTSSIKILKFWMPGSRD
ncbi:hypothetical protein EYR38_006789 [Pleurotus pulmonarius]|nr:hypothetical protein EYR38_006789 [Pleurotus pulmonarius]